MQGTHYDTRRHTAGAQERLREARQATSKTNFLLAKVTLIAVAVLVLLPA